jgi:hypothetical protein
VPCLIKDSHPLGLDLLATTYTDKARPPPFEHRHVARYLARVGQGGAAIDFDPNLGSVPPSPVPSDVGSVDLQRPLTGGCLVAPCQVRLRSAGNHPPALGYFTHHHHSVPAVLACSSQHSTSFHIMHSWCVHAGCDSEPGALAQSSAGGGDGEVVPGSARPLQELPGPDSWELTFEGQVGVKHGTHAHKQFSTPPLSGLVLSMCSPTFAICHVCHRILRVH